MTDAIVKSESTTLSNFGGRDPIKEMALRIQTMMPNAQKLATAEAMAVAQLAFAHGLDPFNGEVWGIKRQDTGQWYGVMVGIKGLRKSARREAKQNDSDYFLTYIKVDPRKYDFQPTDVVYECHLRDVASFQAWVKIDVAMMAAGIDKETIKESLGPAPVVIGVGRANPSEKSKMDLHARAKKRAEADALKQKYDLNFGNGVMVEGQKEVAAISEIAEAAEFGEPVQDATIMEYEQEPSDPKPTMKAQDIIDEMYPAEVPSENVTRKAEPEHTPIDTYETHGELWKQASAAGLINPETVKLWAVRKDADAVTISDKCALIRDALK